MVTRKKEVLSMTIGTSVVQGAKTFVSDVVQGFFEITHNGFAMLGLAVMFVAIVLAVRPEFREQGEARLMSWLQARQATALPLVADMLPIHRATATDPGELPKQQAKVAYWLSKKYKVAPEPISALVAEAYEVGQRTKLDPTLILAIMAVESGFNPFAQSPVGAQGLMQVMTKIHVEKYEIFGGNHAAFDPLANLRVGVAVLQECIRRAGSLEGGLRYYVGAANIEDDGGYAMKVMAEHARLQAVAAGQNVRPFATPVVPPLDEASTPATDTTRVASAYSY